MPPPLESSDQPSLNSLGVRNTKRGNSLDPFAAHRQTAAKGPVTPMEDYSELASLKRLVERDPSEEGRLLRSRLAETDRNAKCIRRAVFLVLFLLMLSLAGLGYGSILVPQTLLDPSAHILHGLCAVGLGALISLVFFLGCLIWNRLVQSGVRTECLLRLQSQSQWKGAIHPTAGTRFLWRIYGLLGRNARPKGWNPSGGATHPSSSSAMDAEPPSGDPI